MARKPPKPRNAVIFHHPDAVDTGRPRLLGRHAAGEGFLKGFIRHAGVETLFAHALAREHFEDFQRRAKAIDDDGRPCRWVPMGDMGKSGEDALPTTLMVPDPNLAPFAWRRRARDDRAYSIVGVNHTIASERVMDGLGDLVIAPFQPWDALICTSHAVRSTVLRMLDNWTDYLNRRGGGKLRTTVELPVIPLGVDCDAYAKGDKSAGERQAIRRGLGIADDDVAVLFMGRLSFHAKAHPTPLYLSLEAAAKRTGKRLHLIQAGWFANEFIEKEFRDGIRTYAPSVNGIFLDGRKPEIRFKVWHAADVFTSLSDNIQETFGLTPIEGMAAGLPVVVSDWDGYRDTVRPNIDGFTIPTWLPLPESGGDLALAPEARLTGETSDQAYEQYCGLVSQCTAVDVAAATEAFAALAADPALRRRMGEAGRKRARQEFDWQVVIKAYQALWKDLENIRNREKTIAPATRERPPMPLRDDPFSLFAAYPTRSLDGDTVATLAAGAGKGAWRKRLDAIRRQRMNVLAQGALLAEDEQAAILEKLDKDGPTTVFALADLVAADRRYRVTRTLGWLAKMGIIGFAPAARGARPKRGKAPPSASRAKGKAGPLIEQAMGARAMGALGEAVTLLQQALDLSPDDPDALSQLGEVHAFAGRFAEARDSFEKALAKEPDSHTAQRNLGKLAFVEGDYAAAAAALKRAAELKPGDGETQFLLGVASRYVGADEDAVKHLNATLENEGERADALAQLGLALKSLGRGDKAVDAFRRALAREPGNVLARAALDSLGAEDGGRRRLGKGAGKRVGLLVHAKFHYPMLKPLFDALAGENWAAISADARDITQFDPAVTVVCDAPIHRLAAMLPKTATVNIRETLAGGGLARRPIRHADFVCVPGPMARDELLKSRALPESRVWVTGFAANDPLFAGKTSPLPFELPKGRKVVLYAPTDYPPFSSAPMLADRVASLIGGERDDIVVIVKPHPRTCEFKPTWVAAWTNAAAKDKRLILAADPAADAAPYLMAADVLVSDASGVMFQYLALDRPIVLVTNPEAGADGERYDPDAIEWRWRDIGQEVFDVADLAKAVENALADPGAGADQRRRYRGLLFGDLTDGRAVERIVDRIAAL
jgi:glycosyltransferase involved in cell wall biosynthesis/tetratricopeptide (TPR) repeat protein